MARIVATLLNLGIIVFIIVGLTQDGPRGPEVLVAALFLAAPIASLIALFQQAANDENSLMGLFLERKRLEQRKKIEDLRKN